MLKLTQNPENIWFSSDQHLRHSNIIQFCNRPFSSVEEQDDVLIQNINEKVAKDDLFFILGDLIFGSNIETITNYISRINGIKYLIMGNHCIQNRMYRPEIAKLFQEINYGMPISAGKQLYHLSHFPYMYYRDINLHGHIHSGPNSTAREVIVPNKHQYDVGVDNNNYYPINLQEITQKFNLI